MLTEPSTIYERIMGRHAKIMTPLEAAEARSKRIEYMRQWNKDNKERRRESRKKWESENVAHVRAKRREWGGNNLERLREVSANYRTKNRDKVNALARSQYRKDVAARPDLFVERNLSYRNALALATPSWLSHHDFSVMEWIKFSAKSATLLSGVKHSVEHIVPIRGVSVCGLHVPWNMSVIPQAENSRKGNRHWPDMWGEQ